jgi:SAM-dependent methyltransferase
MFTHPGDSHNHSLDTLNQLYVYDEFMESIRTVVDLGCGTGEDLLWWATRTFNDPDNPDPEPLNIKCVGVDINNNLTVAHENITYQQNNFEDLIDHPTEGFDILWCHDAFHYARNPLQTLSNWWHIASPGALLSLTVPVTQQIHRRQLSYVLPNGCYYHHTIVSLMYMLATAGWDCGTGFFKQTLTEPWIHAIVYKSNHPPQNLRETDWHKLVELNLLSKWAAKSIYEHGALRQQDLVIPWLDRSLISMDI